MSESGGKYILNSYYESKHQEQFLLNVSLLKTRLKEECLNKPILVNLESTHNNYIKKYYKPSLPMSFEVKQEISEFKLDYGENTFSLPLYGDFMYEMVLAIELNGLSAQNIGDKCAYYDFLGHKLVKHVSIEFAGIKIDEYSSDAYNIYYNYYVENNKKPAYLKAIGQETPDKIILDLEGGFREEKYILNGNQTPKQAHNNVKLFIPIIFDFSTKLDCALFSAKIPFGQRFLKVTLESPENICYGTGPINLPSIAGSLYITHIFVDPEIRTKLKLGNFKSLIRVNREINFKSQILGTEKLDNLRFPVENLFIGLRPETNINPTDWYKFTTAQNTQATFPVAINNNLPPPQYQLAFRTVAYNKPELPLKKINFLTKNINIVNSINAEYFQTIHSYFRGISAADTGIIPVTFTSDINTRNIVSFYNISLEREFFLNYEATTPGNIYILAKCLNWLIIKENGVVELAYSS